MININIPTLKRCFTDDKHYNALQIINNYQNAQTTNHTGMNPVFIEEGIVLCPLNILQDRLEYLIVNINQNNQTNIEQEAILRWDVNTDNVNITEVVHTDNRYQVVRQLVDQYIENFITNNVRIDKDYIPKRILGDIYLLTIGVKYDPHRNFNCSSIQFMIKRNDEYKLLRWDYGDGFDVSKYHYDLY